MDDCSSSLRLPSHLFSSHSTSSSTSESHSRRDSTTSDPGTIAEKMLLRDFGVNSLPISAHALPLRKSDSAQWDSDAVPLPQQYLPAPTPVGNSSFTNQPMTTQSFASFQATPTAIGPFTMSNGVPNPLPLNSTSTVAAASASAQQQTFFPEEKRKKLVSQFATLASRLGITLPPQVVQVLQNTVDSEMGGGGNPNGEAVANTAATDTSGPTAASTSTSAAMVPPPTTSYSSSPSTHHNNHHPGARVFPPAGIYSSAHNHHHHHQQTPATLPPPPLPPIKATPTVQQLQNTAEAAIAAVTEKRKRSLEEAGAASAKDGSAAATLAYSKRRKKPRLADCESRLAQLKSENDVLKRHLHNISNQSHKFDQERAEAETRMKYLLQQDADTVQMDAAIKNYTELYSDYGRRRHHELTFHLEQLQRLANPTNFTKMGLWSLENSHMDPKRNPVAGILQKELAVTAQQGRKILEQRQKIRDVCANLKECFALIGKLKALCEQKTKIFHDRMSKCREILSPKQVVQLLIWIDGHSHLLEKVCPGWGSERIRSKKAQQKKS